MRIKAIPIKSATLCKKCVYDCCRNLECRYGGCPNYNREVIVDNRYHCECLLVKDGEPCRHFKRKENTFPKKTTHGFFVDKCKCGGNIAVQFGFSCTGKPMSTLSCDNCSKAVVVIGNLKHGQKFMDIWEGVDNG